MKKDHIQVLLTLTVSGAWVAVLFIPVDTTVQVGVQGAMTLVLGWYFVKKRHSEDRDD